MVRRTVQYELTIEDLDRELIARGAQIPAEELFKFKDTEGTPQRDDIMEGIKELYDEALSPNPALASIDTWELFRLLLHKTRQLEENSKRGIWYKDHRMDCFGITDEQVKKNVNCVAAIVFERNLIKEKNGFSTLKVKNYGESFNLYDGEAFREQPIAAGRLCTGFLVKKDVIATACHCVLGYDIRDLCFVFGFKMVDPCTAVTQVPNENIYKGKRIIGCAYMTKVNRTDWALVQLDREVEGQGVVTLSKDEIPCEQPVYVMGHPAGLPLKYAPGAKVRGFEDAFFTADLDTYMGSSGSPVFNADTHEVIGIVVHGDARDFRQIGSVWGSIIYPRREIDSKGPQCTKVSEFRDIVDNLS
ncbi:MAG: trypsin-like peptidase domain-containing protein [Candidatus Aminicenantes bacterium]|nr:MAG: trypsin-like peptidase domain-containing protein [Candidatus Aminicenantes bacterium]